MNETKIIKKDCSYEFIRTFKNTDDHNICIQIDLIVHYNKSTFTMTSKRTGDFKFRNSSDFEFCKQITILMLSIIEFAKEEINQLYELKTTKNE